MHSFVTAATFPLLPAPRSRMQVPPGHMWLQGDNLNVSRDSRDYGPVPLGLVKGRAVLQVGRAC